MTRTKRKPYTGSKAFDSTCRNHGSCSYCYNNRMHTNLRDLQFPTLVELHRLSQYVLQDPDDLLDY
jgi:hypothetical protein